MIYLDDLDAPAGAGPDHCGYAPCSATLRPDGPSLYWCNETCMTNWTKAQNSARPLDPAGAEPPRTEPVRGATPTFVVVDEVPGPASARLNREPGPILPITNYVTPAALLSGMVAHAFDRLRRAR